jgi:hypothetical protein
MILVGYAVKRRDTGAYLHFDPSAYEYLEWKASRAVFDRRLAVWLLREARLFGEDAVLVRITRQ